MRVYMAGPMFTAADAQFNLRLAQRLREHGFDVYCPNESEPNNDETREDVTARLIYELDIRNVESCNVVLLQVSEDSGSNWEAGYMDCLARHVDSSRYYGALGMATDFRLRALPHPNRRGADNPAAHVNQLVAGGLQLSLGLVHDEDAAITRLEAIRRERWGVEAAAGADASGLRPGTDG
jgi:hypothetical protein